MVCSLVQFKLKTIGEQPLPSRMNLGRKSPDQHFWLGRTSPDQHFWLGRKSPDSYSGGCHLSFSFLERMLGLTQAFDAMANLLLLQRLCIHICHYFNLPLPVPCYRGPVVNHQISTLGWVVYHQMGASRSRNGLIIFQERITRQMWVLPC